MKSKWLSIILILSLLCTAVPAASAGQVPALEEMTFDELTSLQTALRAELRARPEAGADVLQISDYTVGRDIKPGEYYLRAPDDHTYGSGIIRVYADEETKNKKGGRAVFEVTLPVNGRSSARVQLSEGQIVSVHMPMQISKVDFPVDDYAPPEGVSVPSGYYEVGVDLPKGRYTVHYDGQNAGEVRVYKNMSSFQKHGLDYLFRETLEYLRYHYDLILEDGNILQLYCPAVITKKEPVMLFD